MADGNRAKSASLAEAGEKKAGYPGPEAEKTSASSGYE